MSGRSECGVFDKYLDFNNDDVPLAWQGHSLPIDHMELACKGVGRERTCLNSKAGGLSLNKVVWERCTHKVICLFLETPPVWLVSFRTAGIARSRNPGHNPGQKTFQLSVKARRAERKSFFLSRRVNRGEI